MKLPKGVKRLKSSGSPIALQDAISQLCSSEFNGFVRATAPQGVKEACILVFLQSIPQLAVYQSPERSVYGPEALVELTRISKASGSAVRAEAFFTHDLVEVDTIVTKMKRASVTAKDLASAGIRMPASSPRTAQPPAARPPATTVMVQPRAVTTPAPTARRSATAPPPPPKVVMPAKVATPVRARPPTAAEGAPPPRVVPKVTTRPRTAPAPPVPEGDEEEGTWPESDMEEGEGAEEAPEGDADGEMGDEVEHAVAPPVPRRTASPTAPQKAKPQKGSSKGDEEFLQMLKDVGIKPSPGGSQAEGDISEEDIDQYIAAFETYIDKTKHPEPSPTPERIRRVVDEIIDEMASAAGDDEWTRAFIESQREVVLDKVRSSTSELDSMAHKRDRLSEERRTLTDISKTFQDVLHATQKEAKKHKEELDEIAEEEGLEDSDWLKNEATKLEHQAGRMGEMERALAAVLTTHHRRMERLETDLEETETETATDVKRELIDLESLKKDFLLEMRDRIRSVASTVDGRPSDEGAAKAARSISEGIHDQVEQLEHEHADLEREASRLEGEAEATEEASTELEIDRTVDVRARIEELEVRDAALKGREQELLEMERRLTEDRREVEEELSRSRSQQTTLRALEAEIQRREDEVEAKEAELVDGTTLSKDAEARMKELKAMEARLKAREMQLVARESELDRATERTRQEREEDVEDLKRVEVMEIELRKREEQYSKAQKKTEERNEVLKVELATIKTKLKEREDRISVLQKAEERAKRLEEAIKEQKAAAASGGVDDNELKKVLTYLDDLLAHLPDNVIAEFSESEYFELYDKVLRRLGI